jgi:integrase
MNTIKLPKKSHKGLKIFCKVCRINNPKCNHNNELSFRVIIKVPGGGGSVRTKMLSATTYDDAVIESIEFKKELISNNYEVIKPELDKGNDFSVVGAILKYNQYLRGDTEYAHIRKNVSKDYVKEVISYCRLFVLDLKSRHNIEVMRIVDVSKKDVSVFYASLKTKYAPKTFNKCMNYIKGFFDFLIKEEDVKMKNPFENFVSLSVPKSTIETITKKEFNAILDAVDSYTPLIKSGNNGERKNMYFPWLKNGYKLFLLTGGRREEIVNLKWSDIFVSQSGVKFFMFSNLKVERINNSKNIPKKYVPINADLEELLIEMGMGRMNPKDYILFPERNCTDRIIIDRLSRSFTHYKKGAGIEKNVTLKNLRKTYITWVNQAMGKETGVLTSHSTNEVLENYYLDPTILTAIEKGSNEIKVFGDAFE